MRPLACMTGGCIAGGGSTLRPSSSVRCAATLGAALHPPLSSTHLATHSARRGLGRQLVEQQMGHAASTHHHSGGCLLTACDLACSTGAGAACRQAVGLPSLAADYLCTSVLRLVAHTCCTFLPGQGPHTADLYLCTMLSLLPMLFCRRRGRRARSQSKEPMSSIAREQVIQCSVSYTCTATTPSSCHSSTVPVLPCTPACSACRQLPPAGLRLISRAPFPLPGTYIL